MKKPKFLLKEIVFDWLFYGFVLLFAFYITEMVFFKKTFSFAPGIGFGIIAIILLLVLREKFFKN